MKVNCPACGHSVELDEAYDDFEGQIRCWVCRAVFEIKTDNGYVKAVRNHEPAPSRPREWAQPGTDGPARVSPHAPQ